MLWERVPARASKKMSYSMKKRIVPLGFALAAVLMLISGIWIATRRETRVPAATMTELGQPEITARALDIAGDDYQGKPTAVRANKTTMGELDVISCNPMSAWVSGFYDALKGELDWCNPNTTVWVVDLDGDFRQGNTATRSLSIVLDGAGKFIRLGSGALVQRAELD